MRKGTLLYICLLGLMTVAALAMTAKGALLASPAGEGDRISLRQDSLQSGSRRAHFLAGYVRGK